ncbi:MAG: hypothetical protein Q9170_003163 [Blastenia crenularia]
MASGWESARPSYNGPDHARDELVQGFESVLESGFGADLTIICGNEKLLYHCAIVCPRSKYFAAAAWGQFKVRSHGITDYGNCLQPQQESKTKTIDLSQESLPMVKRMMRYFYVLDYDDQEYNDNNWADPVAPTSPGVLSVFEINAQMYALADQFGVEGLKKVAASKFELRCKETMSSMHASHMNAMLRSVEAIYTSTPEGDTTLRATIARAVAFLPAGRQACMEILEFKSICSRYPDFMWDVLANRMNDGKNSWHRWSDTTTPDDREAASWGRNHLF